MFVNILYGAHITLCSHIVSTGLGTFTHLPAETETNPCMDVLFKISSTQHVLHLFWYFIQSLHSTLVIFFLFLLYRDCFFIVNFDKISPFNKLVLKHFSSRYFVFCVLVPVRTFYHVKLWSLSLRKMISHNGAQWAQKLRTSLVSAQGYERFPLFKPAVGM